MGFLLLAGGVTLSAQAQKPAKTVPSAIQILAIEDGDVKLPAEFEMALYENLVTAVEKTRKFQQVYRDGDRNAAAADLAFLHTSVQGFKEGSARKRQVTSVAGTTSIKVHVQIATRDGKQLLDRDVEGKVHLFGENLRATYNLAKAVAKLIRETF